MNPTNKLTKEQILDIAKLIEKGIPYSKIAKDYDVHIATISYWVKQLRKAGHQIRPIGVKASQYDEKKLINLLSENKKYKEIAIFFQVSIPTINLWVKKLKNKGHSLPTRRGRTSKLNQNETDTRI